jgi:hypothetical protein
VLWPDVDEHVLAFELWLETRRRLHSDRCSSLISNEWDALRPALGIKPCG